MPIRNYFLIIAILISGQILSQNQSLRYSNHFTIDDGLSHTGISCILEDSHGYVWVGTFDGLNRYDGYEFVAYKNTRDKHLFISNRIYALFEDSNGNIWISTEGGISIYDYKTQRFIEVYSHSKILRGATGPRVFSITEDKESNTIICASEQSGLLQFSHNFELLNKFYPNAIIPRNTTKISIYDIKVLPKSNYILSTSFGILNFNLKNTHFSIVKETPRKYSGYVTVVGNSILTDTDEGILVFDYHQSADSITYSKGLNKLTDYRVTNAILGTKGSLWVATRNNGVQKISSANQFLSGGNYTIKSFNNSGGNLNINCMASTVRSGFWLGTIFNNGLYQFKEQEVHFNHYSIKQNLPYDMGSDNIMSVAELDSNRVFICTLNKGISLFNTKTKAFEPIPIEFGRRDKEKVKSVYVDRDKNIWLQVGFQGLFIVKNGKKRLEKVLSNGTYKFLDYIVRSYSEDNEGNLWIGGKLGVFRLTMSDNATLIKMQDLSENPFFKDKSLVDIRSVYADPYHSLLWIASETRGLYRVRIYNNTRVDQFDVTQYLKDDTNPKSISSNFISGITRLPNKELWLSTNHGGVCQLINANTDAEFITYSEKDGLSNHVVTGLSFDSESNLWLSTNHGINKFVSADRRFRIFSKDDGVPFETYKYGSAQLKNGTIVFYGYEGICYFKPKHIRDTEKLPNLEFGSLRIYNKEVLPLDTVNNRVILAQNINNTEEVTLEHFENSIAIELKSIHYSNPRNHFIEYKMLPVNTEWIKVPSNQNVVQYSGLRSGNYTFKVRASNSINNWTPVKELKINVKPPFWRTPAAFILYLALLSIIVYIIIAFRLRIQGLNHSLEIEQLEIDNVKEVNAAKLRFFSNISHEIKTPLTLIAGPVETLVEKYKKHGEISEKLAIVQRQSKKITQLIDQVHDFQRSDANQLKMNNSTFSFNNFIDDLCADFEHLAQSTNKLFQVNKPDEEIYVLADKDKLEKIYNNLLNNAFKYTKENDTITVGYKQDARSLQLWVEDTGKGIDSEDLPFIFERFYQSKKAHSAYTGGSGIGLAFSKRLAELHLGKIVAQSTFGEGTILTVDLPIIVEQPSELILKKEKEVLEAGKLELAEIKMEQKVELKLNHDYSKTIVYLVEDNNDMRMFVSKALSEFFNVKTFANGQECIDEMQEAWPDLIVSDVLMPEVNGFELCRRVKTDIKTSHIPVVLLTACTSIDEQIQGINEGADAYIKKPFNMQHLVSSIESLLQSRQQLRERFQMSMPLRLEREQEQSQSDHIFLEKLYEVINENLDNQDLDVDQLARALYFNRTNFYQKVKAITNCTPFEFLKEYRLTKAAEMLVQNKASVGDVIIMTGFKSRTHFNKVFKERYQVTPSKYAADQIQKLNDTNI
ncbi:hybrid sensor histidine kinase/response regulator transcription factor [Saccharicrinis aurantiacus]|uniref:hybrid sensor histidine kinase/response regulator transcription factor n=1 Tax=Saccharicrinis aurantiacus TaxID=1849719 RepID=UPI000838C9F2|nr:hybrid sensor histidine kinase/response regulator transcription factor [Saccharicrinis aurantiacus]